MKNQIKISVIIPVYNTQKYIKRCIDSVINQTYKDIEIIIINDGSTDKSLIEIQRYSSLKNVKIIDLKNNIGLGASRNIGIKQSSGDYITFVDSDDWLDSNFISDNLIYLSDSENDIICTGLRLIN